MCKALPRWLWPALMLLPAAVFAAGMHIIKLPPPRMDDSGLCLMQALKHRHSTRAYSERPLPPQVLSDLLWAAFGINRPASGGRTAPSAHDWQEITIYVAMGDGLYRYEAKRHALIPVSHRDVRKLTGVQDFVATAPVNLIYVADFARMQGASYDDRRLYSAADTGFIAENVYLSATAQGLGSMVRATMKRADLDEAMGLAPREHITLAQTVGYPAHRKGTGNKRR
ncbi:MAG TPA: SagB/ThcOx family dehydrogenase [Gammaproteobacteria bacterium]|nr:SagB/ThcOx family dehydrogenase [Gammaproteobacteria bacterium]